MSYGNATKTSDHDKLLLFAVKDELDVMNCHCAIGVGCNCGGQRNWRPSKHAIFEIHARFQQCDPFRLKTSSLHRTSQNTTFIL